MKWIRQFELFKESKSQKIGNYSTKNIIHELCTSMVLLNPTFLDALLDKGNKSRYSENSQVFLTDLKNLLMAKNRLVLGKFVEGNKCVEDQDLGKVNQTFQLATFDMESDWDKLVGARITARNIMDKLFPDEKLTPERISKIYFLGPNQTKDHKEDIVLETTDGEQYSFFLNKNISAQKSASFNLFADDLIGKDYEHLFNAEYMQKWNKLTQEWVRILYEGSHKNIQRQIEKFIDTKQIEHINYFNYFKIKHRDPRFKHLGEFMQEFNDNILDFSDLMNKIWDNRETCFMDIQRTTEDWYEVKNSILNSKIIEHLLTTSLKTTNSEDIIKQDGFDMKVATGTVKMKLIKTLVEKLGCLERRVFFLSSNGNSFNQVPSRDFFRKNYNDMTVRFDYHVKFTEIDEEEKSDFKFKVSLELDHEPLLNLFILVKFKGGEFGSGLTAKYKFDIPENFNYRVNQKIKGISNEEN